ncbi:Single-stranded DNA-binding protein 4 [Cricetulus griseus]|uniref:Single-stranded DNA-binding protein 4 n=1 Tax=Cricetulus griseus TaxID=10029 RepID=G3H498_CRIGR|nr:Single-stranded DNA-binding protein 4 [Cricetulus griseus]
MPLLNSLNRLPPACRLALYVYEYLLHVGAQKSAQTFLSEIRWEKNITLGEPPGFLHSWWCVFWDLYCAAPDRREACEHTSEAKVFQDYSTAAPNPVMGAMAPNDAMGAGPVAPGFFQPFMSPRFPGGARPTLRMPGQVREGRGAGEAGEGVSPLQLSTVPPHSLLWASLAHSPSSLVPWTPPHAHRGTPAWEARCRG